MTRSQAKERVLRAVARILDEGYHEAVPNVLGDRDDALMLSVAREIAGQLRNRAHRLALNRRLRMRRRAEVQP